MPLIKWRTQGQHRDASGITDNLLKLRRTLVPVATQNIELHNNNPDSVFAGFFLHGLSIHQALQIELSTPHLHRQTQLMQHLPCQRAITQQLTDQG